MDFLSQEIAMKTIILLIFILFTGLPTACRKEIAVTTSPVLETDDPSTATEPSIPETNVPSTVTAIPVPGSNPLPCISQGSQDDINARLRGPDDEAVLCPGALIELSGPVVYTAAGQQIYTEGYPVDERRATLRIISPDLTTAVKMRDFDGAILSHIVVDGNRPNLGHKDGDGLIYAGGSSNGQIIRFVKIIEPRSWSALHMIEGHPAPNPPCSNALIENNEINSAGESNETWADGISLACTNSIVRNNLIVDATDGGIVVFGAPGSIIEGNTIRAETRTLLGGINMVDYHPYNGSYVGTIVRDNLIDASGAVIRIGLGMGPRVWVCMPLPAENDTLYGGTVTGNILRGAHMQYGYAVDGVRDWTVLDNISEATHAGSPSLDCRGQVASPPSAFQYYSERTQGNFQPEFIEASLELALWAIRSPRPGE